MNSPALTAELALVAERLAATAGVDPRALDASRLQWILEARCRALHLPHVALYTQHLLQTPAEIDSLIDAVIVPETRFFRDASVFEHLRRWLPQLAAEFPGELRLLSAPCSSGQEAWSLASAMLAAGISPARFSITALDISRAALDVAHRALYPADAMRHVSPEHQRETGTFDGQHWKIHEALRRVVRFERRNLADPGALDGETFHLILCRNLFIYLRAEARAALAASLARALVPGGRLILGTADRVEELSALFAPIRPASSFAFLHRDVAAERQAKLQAERHTPAVPRRLAESLLAQLPANPSPDEPTPIATELSSTSAQALFQRAVKHRDAGDLRRAEHRCRQALYVDAHFLPALELLGALWLQHAKPRHRDALAARIERRRQRDSDAALPQAAKEPA